MDYFHKGHQLFFRGPFLFEARYFHRRKACGWSRRRKNAGNAGKRRKLLLPRACRGNGFETLDHRLFAVANDKSVNYARERHGIYCAGTAGKHHWMAVIAVTRHDRYPAQKKHVRNRGIGHFVVEGKAHGIELVQRGKGLQRIEGKIARYKLVSHVGIDHKDPLGRKARVTIYTMI